MRAMQRQQRKLWLIIMRIPPEHRGRQSNNQDPEVPEKLNSQFSLQVFSPQVPSINSIFCALLQNGSTTVLWFGRFSV